MATTGKVAYDLADAITADAEWGYWVAEDPDDNNRIEGGWSFILVAPDGCEYDVVVAPA